MLAIRSDVVVTELGLQAGDLQMIKLLVDHGARTTIRRNDPGGDDSVLDEQTPLMVAIAHSHRAAVELLLDLGADVDARLHDGSTALSVAAQHNSEALVQLLLDRGAAVRGGIFGAVTGFSCLSDANCAEVGTHILEWAAVKGNPRLIRMVFQHGVFNTATPLRLAVSHENHGAVRLLLSLGANPDGALASYSAAHRLKVIRTPVFSACSAGDLATIQLLALLGASLEHVGLQQDYGEPERTFSVARIVGRLQQGPRREAIRGWLEATTILSDRWCSQQLQHVEEVTGRSPDWPLLRMAVAGRLHAGIRLALRLGKIDPSWRILECHSSDDGVPCPITGEPLICYFEEGGVRAQYCSPALLHATASSAAGALWPGSLPPCPLTTAVVRDCFAGWSPSRHFLFHEGTRTQIHFLMLVGNRLRHRAAVGSATAATLPALPEELMLLVGGYILRGFWPNELVQGFDHWIDKTTYWHNKNVVGQECWLCDGWLEDGPRAGTMLPTGHGGHFHTAHFCPVDKASIGAATFTSTSFLDRFSPSLRSTPSPTPTLPVHRCLLIGHADRELIGAWNPMP